MIDNFLDSCTADNPPFLSDLIANPDTGGIAVSIALEARLLEMGRSGQDIFKWKIQVLCDEWGNKPQPGDFVTVKHQKNIYKKPGKPTPGHEMNRAKIDGSFEKKFRNVVKYEVDKKGCISVGRDDATYFIQAYGVHPDTNFAMPHGKPQNTIGRDRQQELSQRPQNTPSGDMMHVWYWRYKEIEKDAYEKLPNLKKDGSQKRGYEKRSEVTTDAV